MQTGSGKRLFHAMVSGLVLLGASGAIPVGTVSAQTAEQRLNLPIQPPPFAGKIAPTPEESEADWQPLVRAPADAPNILLVMTDDVGFAASSTFGGPVPTPNLDRLAQLGLRYNSFNTTGICSPSRAALLTGRNHHEVGTGSLVEMPAGYPGYSALIPDSAATLARVLTLNGYSTAMFGKHHNVPDWEASQAGPFDHWPTGLGFQYFYGFMGGDSDQFEPVLYRGISRVQSDPEDSGKPLDQRLADDAIRWIHDQKGAAPDKPFFVYMAPGSAHAPHQAPQEWIAKFQGAFDQGWDKQREETFARQRKMGIVPANANLTPRPAEIDAWDELSPDAQKVYARMMEVYAGMLAFQDAQIGRVLDELDRMGEAENTLVIFIEGDNGGSAEGGNEGFLNEFGQIVNGAEIDLPWLMANYDLMGTNKTYQNYPAGWAWATNTPFQWTKQISSHLGGVRNGLVISWPQRISDTGKVRTQYSHLIDIMPTVLEAVGIPAPKTVNGVDQKAMDGMSLTPSFGTDTHVPRTQYYEQTGNRAIYKNGWLANTYPIRMPWENSPPDPDAQFRWELYNLSEDYSQSHNLAEQNPDKLKEMQAAFDEEALANNVYPIDSRFAGVRSHEAYLARGSKRTHWTFWSSDTSLMQGTAPNFAGRSFTINVDLDVPDRKKANGVLLASGSWFGGWTFFLKDGKPVAIHAVSRRPEEIFQIAGDVAIGPGRHQIAYTFESDGGIHAGGTMTISIDGKTVGEGRIGKTIYRTAGYGETFDIGRDTGLPVTEGYNPSNLPADAISKVDVDLQ